MDNNNCIWCEHFDPDYTVVPICVLHKKCIDDGWTCMDFKLADDDKEQHAR